MKKIISTAFINFFCMSLVLIVVTSGYALSAPQEEKRDKKPLDQSILDSMGKLRIDYILPRPAIISEVLHQNQFTFTGKVKVNVFQNYNSGVKIALNLGSRCTDGIMMAYEKKKSSDKELEDIGGVIQKLLEDLGLENNLKGISPLKAALKSKNQDEINSSIDNLFAEAETFLRQRDDGDLAILVSLGGWIEMMYYASEELSKNYQEQSARVLAMDYIVDIYISVLNNLKIFVQDTPTLQIIANQLPRVKQLMQIPSDQSLSQEAVKNIYDIANNLKQEIEKK